MQLILSLDTTNPAKAATVMQETASLVSHVKIGHIPMAMGSETLSRLLQQSAVFIDFKLHDIPTTMARAVANYHQLFPNLSLFTLWGTVSDNALKAVVAESEKAMPLSVISLTSDTPNESTFLMQVERNLRCGIRGFITPPAMIAPMRQQFGKDVTLLSPGIRYEQANDHQKPFTPKQAKLAGADYIIVGRPILNAINPKQQCQQFFNDCKDEQ